MVEASNMQAIIAGGADDKEVVTDAAVYEAEADGAEGIKTSDKDGNDNHAM